MTNIASSARICDTTAETTVSLTPGYSGRCKKLNQKNCAYYDYRSLDLAGTTLVDQTNKSLYQVTFPGLKHLWAAMSVRMRPRSRLCWRGGAVVGRNPLSMTWSTEAGSKFRKNNFLLMEGGDIHVKGVRLHNIHDAFVRPNPSGTLNVEQSWITWNRDDFYEGYLRNLSIRNTLVDGTYNFISDPDGVCDAAKDSSDSTLVIENSLIRLQRMPGPFGGITDKWHWKIEGGHHRLWKLDSCKWSEWPKFILKNNVFFIEGPRTSRKKLFDPRCEHALPGSCNDSTLSNIKACENNLFIYEGFDHWTNAGILPGPVPTPGNRFYNPDNPDFTPNSKDCYQRLTDRFEDVNFADVDEVWNRYRNKWINNNDAISRVAGVDIPAIPINTPITFRNVGLNKCLTTDATGYVSLTRCTKSAQQTFYAMQTPRGIFDGALIIKDHKGGYLTSLPSDNTRDDHRVSVTFENKQATGDPWYLLPLSGEPGGVEGEFSIETEAFRRSFLTARHQSEVHFQEFFYKKNQTPSPQALPAIGDTRLRWVISTVQR